MFSIDASGVSAGGYHPSMGKPALWRLWASRHRDRYCSSTVGKLVPESLNVISNVVSFDMSYCSSEATGKGFNSV
ncbi:protein of unknown function [Paraburkholderia kururiensis]